MFPFTEVEYNSRALSKKIYIIFAYCYKYSPLSVKDYMAIDFY
jgi:hypothetical protein